MSDAVFVGDEMEAAIALLWQAAKPRTRGPKPLHSLEELLDAAIGIADREGIEAVSMQRLAQELGFTKMAIYRYVPGRMALVALMTDRALGPGPTLAGGDWRAQMRAWTMAMHGAFVRHPWCVSATTGARAWGPNEAGWSEAGLVALAPTGLKAADRLDTLALLAGHARAMAQQRGDGGPVEAALAASLVLGLAHVPEDAFPQLRATMTTMREGEADEALCFGIDCILDGLDSLLRRAR